MISVVTVVEGEGCALVPGEPANAAVVQVAAANSAGSVRWDIMTSSDATRRPIAARRCAFGSAAFGALATSRTGDAEAGVYVAKRFTRWAIGGNEALFAARASGIVRVAMRGGGGAVSIVGAERAASDDEIAEVFPEAVSVRSA